MEEKKGIFREFAQDWKQVFSRPKEFFLNTPMEFDRTLRFALINIGFYSIGVLILSRFLELPPRVHFFHNPFIIFIYTFINLLLGWFIYSLLLHCFFKLFRGKGGFKQTLCVRGYSLAISVFSWIPVIGIIAEIYGLYITIRGGEVKHNISLGKAVSAVVLSIFIPLLLILLFSISILRRLL
ncbi:MAG: hypothetical protein DRP75_02480 [Candidatus Omnitrophota bacterium]|nr:MAG: hypothetical protein DRP75_02480 [Candidatus Omnitrophota bacterium]